MTRDEKFMQAALELASQAGNCGEVPVGAVVVRGDKIIGAGFNRRESQKNALFHAELEAINEACKNADGWRLNGCELFVTLEPCPMCAGAAINARIRRVVFGACDKRSGSCGSAADLFSLPYEHKPEKLGGVMENECADMLSRFFSGMRKRTEDGGTGIFFEPEGAVFDTASGKPYPDISEALNELKQKYRLFLIIGDTDDDIGGGRKKTVTALNAARIPELFEETIDCNDSGQTLTEAVRMLRKRKKLSRVICIGGSDLFRQASQTNGFPYVHAAYSGRRVRSCCKELNAPKEIPQTVLSVLSESTLGRNN